MTQFSDQIRQGRAYYVRQFTWNGSTGSNGLPSTNTNNTEIHGPVHTQHFSYEIGTASTALASGIVFLANTATTTAGTLSATGALVSGGVATFDVPRCVSITSTTNTSTGVITLRGTDGYGQAQTWSGAGPTGNTFGANGSFVNTTVAFKTITTASMVGTSTAGLAIGSSNVYGLPYRISSAGKVISITVDGNPVATAAQSTVTAGFTATGTTTATTADVRGTVLLPTTAQANDTRYFVVTFITPNVGLTESTDNKERTYGATPFSS